MDFRGLLFSKNQETNSALTAACQSVGIQLEVCSDIFSAIEKGTRQPFSCVLADWSDQPEAGFLLKRARESAADSKLVTIAIVDHDPSPAEMRDHQLNFVILRPIVPQEAADVLAKASEHMPAVSPAKVAGMKISAVPPDGSALVAASAPAGQDMDQVPADSVAASETPAPLDAANDAEADAQEKELRPSRRFPLRAACAAVLAIGAAFSLWNARDTITYLARTSENRTSVFKDAFTAFINANTTVSVSPQTEAANPQQDAYFSRSVENLSVKPQIAVISTEAEVGTYPMRKPYDFPLPSPEYVQPVSPPVEAAHATIPESLRSSSPITRPTVVTVTPAQMMPVATPMLAPISSQQVSEPVPVSEEAERALLIHSVLPVYPPEATAQKLHGPVVLQATIGRDGAVEDLKIVRGSFVLSKAAIAAVKQWRFQPYTLNGHTVETQTLITINFSSPSN